MTICHLENWPPSLTCVLDFPTIPSDWKDLRALSEEKWASPEDRHGAQDIAELGSLIVDPCPWK